MREKTKMPFESTTRIEKLIPDYSKLKFANKEEKQREDELSGFSDNDILVWRQLESQAHMANEQLKKTLDIFQKWLDDYEDVQEMIVVQKALNVMSTFGRLLLALDTERQFLLSNKRVEIREVEVEVEKSGSGKMSENDRKRIALCLCGEKKFDVGGKGRGKLSTYQLVGNEVGKTKETIKNWINQMIEEKYIETLIKNLQRILDKNNNTVKNGVAMAKVTEKVDKTDFQVDKNKKESVESLKKGA